MAVENPSNIAQNVLSYTSLNVFRPWKWYCHSHAALKYQIRLNSSVLNTDLARSRRSEILRWYVIQDASGYLRD